jgi:integrase
MTKRAHGEGGMHWDEGRQRWIVTVTMGYDGRGKRVVRKASGRTKTEARSRLRDLVRDRDLRITDTGVTVGQVVEDWLSHGLGRQSANTVSKCRSLCEVHIVPLLGERRVRDLKVAEVERWLAGRARLLSTSSLRTLHGCLNRSIRRAMARDLVSRNVVDLVDVPIGRGGRPSKSLTSQTVDDVLALTAPDRLHHYIVVSLLTGARTEELRALGWSHVYLDGDPEADPPVPAYIEVWRSVREGGDTKTRKSRRTLALPERCIEALRRQRELQAAERSIAPTWHESDLVFTTVTGTPMDAANVRRDFRRALALVPGIDPQQWTPRELRHSFVSILSDAGVPLDQISQLVGHKGTTVTEVVYRHQLRPVLQTGARVMDSLFTRPNGAGKTSGVTQIVTQS